MCTEHNLPKNSLDKFITVPKATFQNIGEIIYCLKEPEMCTEHNLPKNSLDKFIIVPKATFQNMDEIIYCLA